MPAKHVAAVAAQPSAVVTVVNMAVRAQPALRSRLARMTAVTVSNPLAARARIHPVSDRPRWAPIDVITPSQSWSSSGTSSTLPMAMRSGAPTSSAVVPEARPTSTSGRATVWVVMAVVSFLGTPMVSWW